MVISSSNADPWIDARLQQSSVKHGYNLELMLTTQVMLILSNSKISGIAGLSHGFSSHFVTNFHTSSCSD